MERIPVSGPWITQKEVDYVADAAQNSWYANANFYNERFEKSFAEYIGVNYAISLPSCTSAIHLSLLALGIGPGDEVIIPDITWIATSAPVSYVGATPVFADIDQKTWCLSGESFENCITPKTKAVIPVDLYGGLPDWDVVLEIAKKNNIYVIEDAAEAIGSEYKGKKAGVFGDTGTFSFHGSKTMTTGEGGMLVTDNEGIYNRILFLRDHGRKPGDLMFFNEEVAFKYKMSSVQAALGLAQLERIEELVEKKRQIFQWYKEELYEVEYIILNHEPPETKNTYWMVSVILDKRYNLQKHKLMELLIAKNIDSRPFFHPLSSIPAYKHLGESQIAHQRNYISYEISPYGVNLPSGFNMTKEKVKKVCGVLTETLQKSFPL
jgi:perosamine synthetase